MDSFTRKPFEDGAMAFAFPDSLDAFLIPDEAFGDAYDSLSAEERAVIKTAVARMAEVHGNGRTVSARSEKSMRQGFLLHQAVRPAPWAVVMWDASFAGPTRALAALVPAMLAGVPNILACRLADPGAGPGAFPKPLLATLELAGQELVAEFPPDAALSFIARCCETEAGGSLVLLGNGETFGTIARLASGRGTALRHLAAPVRIGIAASSFSRPVSNDRLRFAQPDAALVPFEGDAAQGGFAAVFCSEEAVPAYLGAAPLVLSPGNEGYWAWHGLGCDFFRETSQGICDRPPA